MKETLREHTAAFERLAEERERPRIAGEAAALLVSDVDRVHLIRARVALAGLGDHEAVAAIQRVLDRGLR